jgi:hypothetical protein
MVIGHSSYGRHTYLLWESPWKTAAWERKEEARITTFFHLAVCLTTGPKPIPKRAFHFFDLELPPSNESIISFP